MLDKIQKPTELGDLHVGVEKGMACEHFQVLLTNLLLVVTVGRLGLEPQHCRQELDRDGQDLQLSVPFLERAVILGHAVERSGRDIQYGSENRKRHKSLVQGRAHVQMQVGEYQSKVLKDYIF